jgi:hypothetical protein
LSEALIFGFTDLSNSQLPRNAEFSIKKIFDDYRRNEHEHHLNLPDKDMRTLGLENAPYWAAAIRYSTHLEVLVTLEGIKPCVLFQADTRASDAKAVFDRQVKTHVLPWFQKYHLARFGFVLQQIKHDLIIDGSDNWRGVWIFANTRSKEWALVKDVFFNPESPFQDGFAIGDALGLPILPVLPYYEARYTYVDITARNELKNMVGGNVGDVIAHDYVGSKVNVQEEEARAHFEKWREVAANHGVELELHIGVNPLET